MQSPHSHEPTQRRGPGTSQTRDRPPSSGTVPPSFRGWQWRLGDAAVSVLARAGVGPIALLTTRGRVTGRPHTVPVVPVEHAQRRWLVAPYGPVSWVHNARATPTVVLKYGRRRDRCTAREVGAEEAGPVLKRYVAIATRAQRCFTATVDAPVEAFIAEAPTHPVFELVPDGSVAPDAPATGA